MSRYLPRIDLDAVSAIDVHVHVESDDHGHLSLDQELDGRVSGVLQGLGEPDADGR